MWLLHSFLIVLLDTDADIIRSIHLKLFVLLLYRLSRPRTDQSLNIQSIKETLPTLCVCVFFFCAFIVIAVLKGWVQLSVAVATAFFFSIRMHISK